MWIGSHKGGVKKMTLLVLAYPELEPADRAWIERIRAEHDPRHIAVAAHVTLVFPVAGMDPDTLIADVARQASGVAPIPFVLRSALPFKWVLSGALSSRMIVLQPVDERPPPMLDTLGAATR